MPEVINANTIDNPPSAQDVEAILHEWDRYGAFYKNLGDRRNSDYKPDIDLPAEWLKLEKGTQDRLAIWIDCCLRKAKTFDRHRTSYGMRHVV